MSHLTLFLTLFFHASLLDHFIQDVQRADYRGDRPALERLYKQSDGLLNETAPQQWVRYWRGFALWRVAVNGFNDHAGNDELESALTRANVEFDKSVAIDKDCVDAKLGKAACLMNLMYIHGLKADEMKTMIPQISNLLAEAQKSEPKNPRINWVRGPALWNTPKQYGGGEDAAIQAYLTALKLCDNQHVAAFEPTWGKAELYMSLAWSHLNRKEPDLAAAEDYAQKTLKLVPDWHYVKDILLPQILKARHK